MNESRKMLKVLCLLGGGERSAAELAECVGSSVVTVKRYIAEARELGAVVESVAGGRSPWLYRLANWEEIRERVELRIRLERESLRGPVS